MAAVGSIRKPLIGTDYATVDGKGRLLITKKKRDRLGDGFAMCWAETGCLNAFPAEEWERLIAKVYDIDPTSEARQTFIREVFGHSDDELSFDDQGRVVIPSKMRELANLDREVTIIGCIDRVEIWSNDEYDKFKKLGKEYQKERRNLLSWALGEMKIG